MFVGRAFHTAGQGILYQTTCQASLYARPEFICQASLYAKPVFIPDQFICQASFYTRPVYMPDQFICQASLYARPEFICQARIYMPGQQITLKSEADCEETIWCNIVTKNSTLTIGVVYRGPNIGQEEDVKLHKRL